MTTKKQSNWKERFSVHWARKFGIKTINKGELGYPDYKFFESFITQEIKSARKEEREKELYEE